MAQAADEDEAATKDKPCREKTTKGAHQPHELRSGGPDSTICMEDLS